MERVRRISGFTVNDSDDAKLDKLARLLAARAANDSEALQLFADLLSLRYEERLGTLDLTPRQHKGRTAQAFISELLVKTMELPEE